MYSETSLSQGSALWRSSGGVGGAIVPADGCVDLILRDGRILGAGPSTRWISTDSDGARGSFGFRLPPGRAGHLLGLGFGLDQIADRLVPLEDLVQVSLAVQLRDAMIPFEDGPNSIDSLSLIATRVAGSSRWSDAVRRSASDATPARDAALAFGGSERSFRRRMLATFGYGYATLVRLERARRAQAMLRRGSPIGAAATAAGFADQSHLSREFARLVGVSPGQFAASSA